jgi:kynurenine formamidase
LLALLLVAACAAPPPSPAPTPAPSHSVDLSHVVRQDVPYPPAEPPTRLDRDDNGHLSALTIGAHTGTRLELIAAPGAAVSSVDQLSPRDLVLPAAVIDVRHNAQDNPGFALSVADVEAWELANGPIAPNTLVLLVTGWDVRWGDPGAYLLPGPSGDPLAPGFSPEAARLLLEGRMVAGLALDSPAAPRPAAVDGVDHWLWLANLTSLEQLPPTGATIVVGALKVQAAQSSPARVLALIP